MLGVSIGMPMFIGGLLAGVPVLAVVAIAALGVGTALLARRHRLGQIAMTVSLPMVGVGRRRRASGRDRAAQPL